MSATVPNHLIALEKANHNRLARAALKRQLRNQEASAAAILGGPVPPELVTMPVASFLIAQRGWSRRHVLACLAEAQISEMRPLGNLTPRQRRLLAGLVEAWLR